MTTVNGTTSGSSTGSITGAGGMTGAAQQLGKNEFLKLLTAQLQNQDPLKPQDNSQFVAELAQFSNLEQTVGINDRLDALALQTQGLQNSNIVDMVGSKATVRGSMVTAAGSGAPVPVRFTLDGDADKVSIAIADLNGKVVRRIDLGDRKNGLTNITWDGKSDAGLVQPAGTYTVAVTAKKGEKSVSVTQETSGKVKSVSFDKGYPVLQLDNGVAVPVADLLRIE